MSGVQLPGNGSVIATETVGSAPNAQEVQRIKIMNGAGGADGGNVTPANPFPVQAVPNAGALADRSGVTATLAGSSVQVMAANTARKYLLVQNPADAAETLFVNIGVAASTTGNNSVELQPGDALIFENGFVPSGAVNAATASASLPFIAKEA